MDDFKKEVCKILLKRLFAGGGTFCAAQYEQIFMLDTNSGTGTPRNLDALVTPLDGLKYELMPKGMKAELIKRAMKPIAACRVTPEEVDELLNPKSTVKS